MYSWKVSKMFQRSVNSRFRMSKKNIDIAQKMKFSITHVFSKYDQIRKKLRIFSHLLKKSIMGNFIFLCSVTCKRVADSKLIFRRGMFSSIQPCFHIINPLTINVPIK